ncbi:hypothetical protein ACFUMH_05270 [Cellulomonas sp. NPDC057328]|uniref:hypothetical protein n=1 Tax=Cellulomonas sp. NPDC057328 TaxID=3346101 RepID=UPI0036334605
MHSASPTLPAGTAPVAATGAGPVLARPLTPSEVAHLDRLRAWLQDDGVDVHDPAALDARWVTLLATHAADAPAPAAAIGIAVGDVLVRSVPGAVWMMCPGPDGATPGVVADGRVHAPVLAVLDAHARWRLRTPEWTVDYVRRATVHLDPSAGTAPAAPVAEAVAVAAVPDDAAPLGTGHDAAWEVDADAAWTGPASVLTTPADPAAAELVVPGLAAEHGDDLPVPAPATWEPTSPEGAAPELVVPRLADPDADHGTDPDAAADAPAWEPVEPAPAWSGWAPVQAAPTPSAQVDPAPLDPLSPAWRPATLAPAVPAWAVAAQTAPASDVASTPAEADVVTSSTPVVAAPGTSSTPAVAAPVTSSTPAVVPASTLTPEDLPHRPTSHVQDLALRALEHALEQAVADPRGVAPFVLVRDGERFDLTSFPHGEAGTLEAREHARRCGLAAAAVGWTSPADAVRPYPRVVVDASAVGEPGIRVAHAFVHDAAGGREVGGPEVVGQAAPVL